MEKQIILKKQAIFYKKILSFYLSLIMITTYELKLFTSIKHLLYLLYFLQNHTYSLYKVLVDIVVIDYPGTANRFRIVYCLLSFLYNARMRVVIEANELESVPSLASLYFSANWSEREAWDMYGISFMNHVDLRRILTDYGFDGHPLRKDFPLTGFLEIYYNDEKKRITYVPLSLSQSYKNYKYNFSWRYSLNV
jgi:NADH/F420H2 dehydrogenase subunit C